MMRLRYRVSRGGFELDVDTRIPVRGVTGIFGESGSGKTTLLRCIAGLERGDEDRRPAHRRAIGYVFQESGLFPHLDVRRNIEYGLRRSHARRVDMPHVIEMLEIGDLMHRKPRQLSGGEVQRVAIAAALLCSPDLVLMDEPLASLDRRRRDELLPYFDRLRADLSVPLVYVSHDINEVSRLCDHLLIMEQGRIAAEGSLEDVLSRLDLPALSLGEAGTVIEGVPERYDEQYGLTLFCVDGTELWVPGRYADDRVPVRLRIAAGDVSLCRDRPERTTILNIFPVRIEAMQDVDAARVLVRLRIGGQKLLAQVTRKSAARLQLLPGDRLYAQIKSATVRR